MSLVWFLSLVKKLFISSVSSKYHSFSSCPQSTSKLNKTLFWYRQEMKNDVVTLFVWIPSWDFFIDQWNYLLWDIFSDYSITWWSPLYPNFCNIFCTIIFVIYFKIIFIAIYLCFISPSKSSYSDFSDWSSISVFLSFSVTCFPPRFLILTWINFTIMSAF